MTNNLGDENKVVPKKDTTNSILEQLEKGNKK